MVSKAAERSRRQRQDNLNGVSPGSDVIVIILLGVSATTCRRHRLTRLEQVLLRNYYDVIRRKSSQRPALHYYGVFTGTIRFKAAYNPRSVIGLCRCEWAYIQNEMSLRGGRKSQRITILLRI